VCVIHKLMRLIDGICCGAVPSSGIELRVFGEEVDNFVDEIVEEFGEFGFLLNVN
jgi:hypothetical protein